MQDHDFEKQVHQKMEEMKIPPSDAVWKEVERRLHPKSKRRRWAWIPFLFFAIVIGGYLMYTNKPASHQSLQPGADFSLHKSNAFKDKTERREEVSKTLKKEQDAVETAPLSSATKKRYSVDYKMPSISRQLIFPDPSIHSGSHAYKAGNPETDSLLQNNSTNSNQNILIKKLPVDTRHLDQAKPLSSELTSQSTDDSSGHMMITKEPVPARVNATVIPSYPVNTSLALLNLRVAANAPMQKQQKRSGWEWGFSVRAGQSGVTNGMLSNLFANGVVEDISNSPSFGNQSVNPSATYVPPSTLRQGAGYSAGVLVKKQLTRRSSVSAGLQYTRFSTSQKVGKQVTDSSFILRSGNSADQKAIEKYFRLGNTGNYINKYHFIELPVLFETRLTPNRFLPVYWDIGFSFSRLVSSNALHFNGNARIYYTNNSLLNRNQFSFITGLPIRILKDEEFLLKAGPLFQYGISDQMNRAGSGSRHLLFIGVKADISLFK